MNFSKGGKWLVGAVLFASLLSAPLMAVEGAGAYRGSAMVFPHFTNTANVNTFYRIVNAFRFSSLEAPWQDPIVAPFLDQRNICVHITYLQPQPPTFLKCEERDFSFCMTRDDYKLVDVRRDPAVGAPVNFVEGYSVAWAVRDNQGAALEKILHNHLFGDEVTIDLVNARAWGTNSHQVRAVCQQSVVPAVWTAIARLCDPTAWFQNNGDGGDFVIMGEGQEPEDSTDGGSLAQVMQYENMRYAEDHFATLISELANLSGVVPDPGGTNYVVIPISWIMETDLNNNGVIGGVADPWEAQNRSVWVPEELEFLGQYSNRYSFDVHLWNSDEQRISTTNHLVICYRRFTANEITSNGSNNGQMRGFGNERWQGWIHIEGEGQALLPMLNQPRSLNYWNRAVIVQIDAMSVPGQGNTRWGFYTAHDRTTANLNPEPTGVAPVGPNWPIAGYPIDWVEPDAAPVYF